MSLPKKPFPLLEKAFFYCGFTALVISRFPFGPGNFSIKKPDSFKFRLT